MTRVFQGLLGLAVAAGLLFGVAPPRAEAATPERVTITGEVIDTWCYITEVMFAEGSAHHQCAIWCAVGGIPVSILGDDGQVYMVLRVEDDDTSVAAPSVLRIQSHHITVIGDLYRRDGTNYILVTSVEDDQGVVNLTHDEWGVVPFGP